MKDKILVRVSVPMADIAYDVRIPLDLSVGTACDMIAGMLRRVSEEKLPLSAMPVLWCARTGNVPDRKKTVRELGITDSDLLLLL